MKNLLLFLFLCFCIISYQEAISSASSSYKHPAFNDVLSDQFKKYWYSGTAEINSYKITQKRYGEIRNGHTVHIYVSENLNKKTQIKTNKNTNQKISVLKLNKSKKFTTGIYPYSLMTSIFSPLQGPVNNHALKASFSSQEWCGHTYAQLNNFNNKTFEVESHSYFEGEGDQKLSIKKSYLEDEILLTLRKNPALLPSGKINIFPSFEFLRLNHKPLKSVEAIASINIKKGEYQVNFKKLERILKIQFNPLFPYLIKSWQVSINGKTHVSAKIMKSLKTPYWSKNKKIDSKMRTLLNID